MKKARRVVAFAGAVILVVLYALTLIFAVMQTENWQKWFEAALFCSLGLPILLYAMQLMYRVLNRRGVQDQNGKNTEKEQSPAEEQTPRKTDAVKNAIKKQKR